jgi:hypothetical protein
MPWVRVRDDGQYWCAYCETPTMAVDHEIKRPEIAARIGDLVLIEFYQSQHASTFARLIYHYDVAGNRWTDVGAPEADLRSGKYDEAWYTLDGLAGFPDRFPAAWEALRRLTPDPSRSARRRRRT